MPGLNLLYPEFGLSPRPSSMFFKEINTKRDKEKQTGRRADKAKGNN
jgi:hypothetical protein